MSKHTITLTATVTIERYSEPLDAVALREATDMFVSYIINMPDDKYIQDERFWNTTKVEHVAFKIEPVNA